MTPSSFPRHGSGRRRLRERAAFQNLLGSLVPLRVGADDLVFLRESVRMRGEVSAFASERT